MFELRDYQRAAIKAIPDYFFRHDGNPLIVLPTGTGKSLCLAGFAQEAISTWPGTRILIATHVKELIQQNFLTMIRMWPEAPAGIYSAGLGKRDIHAQILFAGIQSIYKRAVSIQKCDLVLIDEAHLIGRNESGMYRKFLADLKTINPAIKVIGFTATPYRVDSGLLHKGDDRLFTDIAYQVRLLDMVQQGYLCEVVPKQTKTQLDVKGVGTRGGEFIASELEAAVDIEHVTAAAVDEIVTLGKDRGSWLIFCSGVAHAKHVRDEVRKWNIEAETVTGDTPGPERDRILTAFKNGSLRCVTNANVLTTGFDAPGVDLIAMLRPTKSVGLYVQIGGRGMRLAEGKENCLILDFAGNTKRHGPIDTVDGGMKDKDGGEGEENLAPVKVCPECKTINHAAKRECLSCGYVFPPPVIKVAPKAATAPLLSTQNKPLWIDVSFVRYHAHEKEDKPTSLCVTYMCGMVAHREWVGLQHSGYPRQKAVSWWMQRAGGLAVPNTVADALIYANAVLKKPRQIQVRQVGRYTEIVGAIF